MIDVVFCAGIETKFGNKLYPELIDVNHVLELRELKVKGDGILVGSAATLTEVESFFKEIIKHEEGKQDKQNKNRIYFKVILYRM